MDFQGPGRNGCKGVMGLRWIEMKQGETNYVSVVCSLDVEGWEGCGSILCHLSCGSVVQPGNILLKIYKPPKKDITCLCRNNTQGFFLAKFTNHYHWPGRISNWVNYLIHLHTVCLYTFKVFFFTTSNICQGNTVGKSLF